MPNPNNPDSFALSRERMPSSLIRGIIAAVLLATGQANAEPPQPKPAEATSKVAQKPYAWHSMEEGVYAFYRAKTIEEKRAILLGLATQYPVSVFKNQEQIPDALMSEILRVASERLLITDPDRLSDFRDLVIRFPWGTQVLSRIKGKEKMATRIQVPQSKPMDLRKR